MRTVLKYLFFVAFLFGTQTAYSQRKVIANKKVGFQFVKNSKDFYGFDAPLPMFQAPVMGQIRTIELSKFQTYANIDYQELIPQRFEQSIAFEIEIPGMVNAIRFATQNILAVNLAEQRAITWPNQCLVLPIQHPIQAKTGDKANVSIAYDAGGSVESLWQSLDIIGPEE